MKNDDDRILRKMASLYVDIEGKKLKAETKDLDTLQYDFTNLDKKVKKIPVGHGLKRYYPLAIVAAMLLLVVYPVYTKFATQDPTPNLSASHEGLNEQDIIALAFELPETMEVSKVEQDKGQTIYYIADNNLDHVVLTAEKGDDVVLSGFLHRTQMNGTSVYYKDLTDYKIVEVNKDGILYTLTCKYDINTLMAITEKIV